jgi:hypothetical protein
MCKKIIIVVAISIIINLATRPTYGLSYSLTSSQINEAIEYGKKNKRASLQDFIRPWVISLGEKAGWATLYSAYHNVAFKSKKAAVERRDLSQSEIFRALQIKEYVTFTVSVFGDYMEFARGYNAFLSFGEETIYPVFSYMPEFAEPSKFYPNTPTFVAGCVFKFSKEEIDPGSTVTLLVTSPEGDALEFVFDLSKIK